jgi:hypothetical protein
MVARKPYRFACRLLDGHLTSGMCSRYERDRTPYPSLNRVLPDHAHVEQATQVEHFVGRLAVWRVECSHRNRICSLIAIETAWNGTAVRPGQVKFYRIIGQYAAENTLLKRALKSLETDRLNALPPRGGSKAGGEKK